MSARQRDTRPLRWRGGTSRQAVSPLGHQSDQSGDHLYAKLDSARHILQLVSHMQRLGRASVGTASSKVAVPACRVVGFIIPTTQCNRCVEGFGHNNTAFRGPHPRADWHVAVSPISACVIPCRRAHRFRVHAVQQSAQEPSGSSTGGAAVASGPAAGTAASSSSSTGGSGTTFDLVCPICLTTPLRLQQVAGRPCGDLRCQRCARTFTSNATFADLTLTAGIQQKAYQQSSWGGTTIFQSPLVSFVYERGWRQGFAWAGGRHCGVDRGVEGWQAGIGSTAG